MSDLNPISLELTQEGAAFITLDRADKRNAFDESMISALIDVLETIRANENIRIVFIRGKGNFFSVGGDIDFILRQAKHDELDNEEDGHNMAQMLHKLYHLPQFTVALINGGAYGLGAGIIAACDYSIAEEKVSFGFPEVRVGMTVSVLAPYLIEAIGVKNARALFATGMPFDAKRAMEMGLINEVALDENDLDNRQEIIADLIFNASPYAISQTKELIEKVKNKPINNEMIKETAKHFAHTRKHEDALEGMEAFLEKRQPKWTK